MTVKTNGSAETAQIGAALARRLKNQGKSSCFVALYGEMGVGKTAFVGGFCREIGIFRVKSPTYTLVNEYRSASDTVYHLDLCRLEAEEALDSIGFDEYLSADAFILCEWAERLTDLG